MNAEKVKLAKLIDTWVQDLTRASASAAQADERMLENMADYMTPFKQLLDTCTTLEMNLLVNKYEGLYRFANLLERLAQAIQDGDITVPEDTPFPGSGAEPPRQRKERPRKPQPRRRQQQPKQQAPPPPQIRREISFLPAYTEIILGELAQTREQYATFAEARSKAHVLDDDTVDRALKVYREQLTFIPLHEKQLNWWLSEDLTDAQRYQVADLKKQLSVLQEKTEQLLALLAELRQGTINRIMEMDDEELGRKILSGEIQPPWQK